MIAYRFERAIDFNRFRELLEQGSIENSLLGGLSVTVYMEPDIEKLPPKLGELFRELEAFGLAMSWVPVGLCV